MTTSGQVILQPIRRGLVFESVVRSMQGVANSANGKDNRCRALVPEPEQRYTLLVVSNHGSAPTKSVAFSRRLVVLALCLLVCSTAALTWFICCYRENNEELAELRYMHQVAETQREQIVSLQEQCQDLSSRLRQTELTEAHIADMLDQEGLLPQSTDSGLATASVQRPTQTTSRDGLSNPRQLLNRDLGGALYALGELTKDFDRRLDELDSRVENLHETATKTVDFYRAKPNMWPTRGQISSTYGPRRHPVSGVYDMHEAVDIAAAYGQAIKAPADGTVIFAGYKYGYGYTVILSHKFGFGTLYAHCSRLQVSIGQEVKRGDTIANVGQSGTATGPHLHYEVRLNGRTVDPEDGYLP